MYHIQKPQMSNYSLNPPVKDIFIANSQLHLHLVNQTQFVIVKHFDFNGAKGA